MWILLFPAYLHFYNLDEADFLSSKQIWENPDSEVLLAGFEKKGTILGANSFSIIFLLCALLFEGLLRFTLQTPSLREKALVLRC